MKVYALNLKGHRHFVSEGQSCGGRSSSPGSLLLALVAQVSAEPFVSSIVRRDDFNLTVTVVEAMKDMAAAKTCDGCTVSWTVMWERSRY